MSEPSRPSSGTLQRDSQRKRPVLLSILALVLVVAAVVLALTLRSCSSQEGGGDGTKPPGGEAEAEELNIDHVVGPPYDELCVGCHFPGDVSIIHGGYTGCPRCHGEGVTPSRVCSDCHPEPHAGVDHMPSAPFDTACLTCHNEGDAAAIHGGFKGCGSCHGPGVTPSLVCTDCHSAPHSDIDHAVGPPFDATCLTCHSEGDAVDIHGGLAGCANCHGGEVEASLVCSDCHPAPHSDADHTVPPSFASCLTCHTQGDAADIHGGLAGCSRCHGPGVTPSLVCSDCHPAPHSDADHTVPPSFASCLTCHTQGDAADIHGGQSGCVRCHGSGTTPSLVCSDCHPDPHAGADHTVPPPYDVDCLACHTEGDGAAIHGGYDGCARCHAAGIAPSLDCVDCHTIARPPHSDVDHTVPPPFDTDCTGCHDQGDATAIHGGQTGCVRCHAPGVTPSLVCSDCHPTPHAGADHTVPPPFDADCTGCHDQGDAAAIHGGYDGCVRCHGPGITPSLVCSDCHPDPHAGADHTVPPPFDADCTGCHDEGDAAAIHGGTTGCVRCHGPGITPSLVCSDCHTIAIPPHSDVDHTVPEPFFTDCTTCHDQGDAAAIHGGTTGCYYCHADGATPSLVCSDCHTIATPPHSDQDHTVPPPFDADCTGCHDQGDAAAIHGGTTGCVRCHGPGITPSLVCSDCHTIATPPHSDVDHTVPPPFDADCTGCHDQGDAAAIHGGTTGCVRCHGPGITPSLVCSDCHTDPHAGADHTVPPPFDADCTGCHDQGDAAAIHGGTTGCVRCHGPGITPSLVCSDCHTVTTPPHSDADHTANVADTVDSSGFVCSDCHSMDLPTEHGRTSSSVAAAGCDACHPAPRDTLPTWEQGCVQGGCHVAGSGSEQHGQMAAAHAQPETNRACTMPACHDQGDVAAVHEESATRCLACHSATSMPASRVCTSCHEVHRWP